MLKKLTPWPLSPGTMLRTGLVFFVASVLVKTLSTGSGGWTDFWGEYVWAMSLAELILTGLTEFGVGLVVGSFILAALQPGGSTAERGSAQHTVDGR